jgi:hypothetical protein
VRAGDALMPLRRNDRMNDKTRDKVFVDALAEATGVDPESGPGLSGPG